MSIFVEDINLKERDADMALRDLFNGTSLIDELRRDNEGREFVARCAKDIELVRDRLSRIVDDVRGI